MRVGILGGGQLGRMLALAGYPLGLEFRVFETDADAPAGQLAELVHGRFDNPADLDDFATGLDAVTYEFENVPVAAASRLAHRLPVFPSPRALEVAQDRKNEKDLFRQLGIATPLYATVASLPELEAALGDIGLPAVLKTRRLGYDGKGQWVLREPADTEAAWNALRGVPLLLEAFVPFDRELSILTVRAADGRIAFYPLVQNHHAGGILRVSFAPAPGLTPALTNQAQGYAKALAEELNYVGVLALELFEVDGKLLANEMAPRVHNSGHWTIEGAMTSQFENHLRAGLGLPLGRTDAVAHCAMINLLGTVPPLEALLAIPNAHPHLYGKEPREGRKLGHVTVRAGDEQAARTTAERFLAKFGGTGADSGTLSLAYRLTRKATAILPLFVLLVALLGRGAGADERQAKIVLGPSLTAPAQTRGPKETDGAGELYVWWNVDAEVAGHRVEYGTTQQLGQRAQIDAATRFPNVKLEGLRLGVQYFYRVATGTTLGDIYSFRLPAADEPFRLVLWADNQHGYEVFERQTVPLARRLEPDFLLVPGDVVEMGFLYRDWARDLYGPAGELLRQTPWFPVRGNHDGEFALARDMMPLPESNRWYARTYGPLRLVVLDTNVDYEPHSEQVRWLEREVAGNAWRDASFRIASFHHPPFNLIQNRANDDGTRLVREILVPILENAATDLVVCGHAHVYERGERTRPDGGQTTYLVVGGGGGRLDDIRAGNWPHIKVSIQKHHIVVADVTPDRIEFRVMASDNGAEIDAFAVTGGPLEQELNKSRAATR